MSSWEWFFALFGVAIALIPLALDKLGTKVPRWVFFATLVAGFTCLLGAVSIPAYRHWFTPTSFVYLFPGRALGENSVQAPQEFIPRRVFVLQHAGPEVFQNVEVVLNDNRATGQNSASHTENYPEVGPRGSQLELQPKHFWFQPSMPWNEDYTVTLKSGERLFLEHILVRGLARKGVTGAPGNPPQPPTVTHGILGPSPVSDGRVDLAIRLTEEGSNKALYSCHDDSLWHEAEWSKDEPKPCPEFISETRSIEAMLDPKPYTLGYPSGVFIMTPDPPPLSSHPESEHSTRELTGWQQEQIQRQLEKFAGNKILIVYSGDSEALKFAKEFRDVFQRSRWDVKGPVAERRADCIATDVELLTWKNDYGHARPQVSAVRDALEAAGVKGAHYYGCVLNSPKALVLWVGVKSPDENNIPAPTCPQAPPPEVDKLVSQF